MSLAIDKVLRRWMPMSTIKGKKQRLNMSHYRTSQRSLEASADTSTETSERLVSRDKKQRTRNAGDSLHTHPSASFDFVPYACNTYPNSQ